MPDPDVASRLAAACDRNRGWGIVTDSLRRLSGGASQETWSFDATGNDNPAATGTTSSTRRDAAAPDTPVAGPSPVIPLILRRNRRRSPQALPSEIEFDVLNAAMNAGVAVPEPVFLLADDDGLGSGYIMRRLPGETIARKILRDEPYARAREVLTDQAAHQLALIHQIDCRIDGGAVLDLPAPPGGTTSAAAQLQQYRVISDGFGEPHPMFEVAMRWLAAHEPDPLPPTIVHGDFRLGNFLVDEDGLVAVLDWELAHVGDPAEDIGWLCARAWRFGNSDRVVGGFGDLDRFLDQYRQSGGADVDAERVRFWIVMATFKWGITCQAQAFTHRAGISRSVELAAIGRRVCENEWDLLDLLRHDGSASPPLPCDEPAQDRGEEPDAPARAAAESRGT